MYDVLTNILNNLNALIYVSDMETDEVLFINDKMKQTFDIGDEAVGQTCWRVFQDGFTERCSFCPNNRLQKEPDAHVEWQEHNTVTGRYYKNVDSIIEWTNGRKVHLQHSTDITDMLMAQWETSEVKDRLQLALSASQTGVWEVDLKSGDLTYDERCGALLDIQSRDGKINLKEMAGVGDESLSVTAISGIDTIQWLLNYSARDDGKAQDFVVRSNDGKITYVRSYGKSITDEKGDVVRIVGMCMDITQSVLMENELKAAKTAAEKAGRQEADERTQVMLDATPLAASFWDAEGNMLDCNMEAVRLFGLQEKADYMEHFYELNPEYQEDGMLTADKTAIEIGAAFETGYRRFDWMYRMLDGTPLPVETTLVRVMLRGEPRLAAYSRDLREIRAIEKQKREAEEHSVNMEIQAKFALAESKAKSQFLSNMSHEIRTPMNAILGMAELLSYEGLSKRQIAYVNDIRTSATSLLGIINDILDFSKIETGKFQLIPVHFDFRQMLNNLRSMFVFATKGKNISFELKEIGDIPPCLYGDDIRMRQALVNVLGNAVKFTKQGGVVFTVRAEDESLCFDIADTGMGMKAEDIPVVFQEFSQLDMENNRMIAGTGLGLSITKQLIDLMEGSIWVESEYGKGTIFHIRIPLVPGDETLIEGSTDSFMRVHAPEANVLVVDDNEVNLNVASGLLRLSKITCDTASSGQEAIDKIAAKKYDIVFMDHMMPEMDGVETTRILRKTYDLNKLIIVALTANAVEGVRETLLEAKMNDYISKPIDTVQLNRILKEWLPEDKVQISMEGADGQKEAYSPLLTQVMAIKGVDVPLGLERIGGMQDVYETSLGILTRRLPEVKTRLQSFLAANDLKGFSIEVHGLKGSLNNIGATRMADKAEALELKSKDGNGAFCEIHLPDLIADIDALHGRLAAILDRNKPEQTFAATGDRDVLAQQLAQVRELLDAFESDEAAEKLGEIRRYDFGEATNDALEKIAQRIEEFAYDEAIEMIDQIG